ncbi:MAG: [FeFe] hydrogenase, group A [Victivallaceae bacterium]
MEKKTLKINGRETAFTDERNLLEVIRKAGIDLPTFCYHSELSIYGACRLCLVEVAGRGIFASCSTAPEPGMEVLTDTREIRKMRKINVELLLANHKRECPSCSRSANCSLQNIARKLGVSSIRYKQPDKEMPLDCSSVSLVRDPNKCVLCGDCVRVCREVQTVGALDFTGRGSSAKVEPAFGLDLAETECVNCGQCAAVCPTGAIVPNPVCDEVWAAIQDPQKTVVVQIAPAVRVALGEYFGFATGSNISRRMVSALKMMGFDFVYDTCFAADMTIFEEATELIGRIGGAGKMPMFTSCCPGWVKFVETFYPEFLPNVSTTRSPQQIFGAVARKTLPEALGVAPENLVIVSVMPCTAKKFEAKLPKFAQNGRPDVDYVLTTIELGQMIESMGIDLQSLDPEAFDMPLGFSTGGGVIFGATGGVMEAALRFAVEKISGKPLKEIDFKEVRGLAPRKEALLDIDGKVVRVAVVHGLGHARALIEDIKSGKAEVDFVEVMACPGGCVSGGGQPITDRADFRTERARGLYDTDKDRQLQKPQDNFWVEECYRKAFGGKPGSHEAHHDLHTGYANRSLLFDVKTPILHGAGEGEKLEITVPVSTRKADCTGIKLIDAVVDFVEKNGLADKVAIDAAFRSRAGVEDPLAAVVGEVEIPHGTDFDATVKAVTAAVAAALE